MSIKRLSIDFSNMVNKQFSIDEQTMNIKTLRIDCWEHTKQFCQTISSPPSSIRENYDNDFLLHKIHTTTKKRQNQIFVFMIWIQLIAHYYLTNHWY